MGVRLMAGPIAWLGVLMPVLSIGNLAACVTLLVIGVRLRRRARGFRLAEALSRAIRTSGRRRAGSFAACVRSSLPRRSRSHSSDSYVTGRVEPPGHGLDWRCAPLFAYLLRCSGSRSISSPALSPLSVALVALVMPDGPAQTLVLGYGMGAAMCVSGLWLGLTAERTSQRVSEAPTSADAVSAPR